jgi:hypothetical protein
VKQHLPYMATNPPRRGRQRMEEEMSFNVSIGTVVGVEARVAGDVIVRTSGQNVHTRCTSCVDGLSIGDEVILARVASKDKFTVIGRIATQYSQAAGSSRGSVLAPPENLTLTGLPRAINAQWDTYPGCVGVYVVELAPDSGGSPDTANSTEALVTRGSHYTKICTADDDTETWYVRVSTIDWISENTYTRSAWTSWASATSTGAGGTGAAGKIACWIGEVSLDQVSDLGVEVSTQGTMTTLGDTGRIGHSWGGPNIGFEDQVTVEQPSPTAAKPAFKIIQSDTDQPFIQLVGGTIYTSKTGEDEYLMIKDPNGNTRYIRLYS